MSTTTPSRAERAGRAPRGSGSGQAGSAPTGSGPTGNAPTDTGPSGSGGDPSADAGTRPPLWSRLAAQAWGTALLVLGCLPFSQSFSGSVLGIGLVVLLCVPAVLVGPLVVGLAALLRLPRWVAALAAVMLLSTGLVLTAGGPMDALPRLLTAARPAPADPAYLAPVLVLVAAVSVLVALLEQRLSRLRVVPVAAAAVLYACALLLSAGTGDPRGVVGGLIVLLAVGGWVALGTSGRGGGVGARRLLAGASIALVAAALPMVSPADRPGFEPRELVEQPQEDVALTSPLPLIGVWGDQSDAVLLQATGAVPARLSLAVLPDYTGAAWTNSSTFVPVGSVAPSDLPGPSVSVPYDAEITIGALSGGWAPAGGTVTGTTLPSASSDPDSGALVTSRGLTSGQRYTVRGSIPGVDEDRLAAAAVPGPDEAARYLALPSVPAEFTQYATSATTRARTRLQQAAAIEELVRSGRRVDPAAPGGSSYARLSTFLFGGEGQSGTSEQFASSFAVLARSLGLPTRLVVGFEVPAESEGVVVGGDASAWPEVYFSGIGWVPFDPTPEADGATPSTPRSQVLDDLGESVDLADDGSDASAPEDQGNGATGAEGGGGGAASDPRWWVLYAVAALGVLGIGGLGVARSVHTRGLRRRGPLGAWQHQVEAMALAGAPASPDTAAPDLAVVVAERTGLADDGLLDLAHRADLQAFGPPVRSGSGRDDASWGTAQAAARALRRGSSLRRRLVWWVDPAPLRRR